MLINLIKKFNKSRMKANFFHEKSNANEIDLKQQPISENLEKTISIFKKFYSIPTILMFLRNATINAGRVSFY
ncbi:hypothetical protein F7731_15945 [Cytobacillus depressus]|uniref:Uncharacterized protein n=1 Tax=Cytobacillus depressus TaxID=1602942 RepID=A0A6L3V809_9BACI|nr:hypothetical protein [Cytobacillus depressus]KAB2333344.1 hypothetical protein F7731_15945 [Cytobacillus depressus]